MFASLAAGNQRRSEARATSTRVALFVALCSTVLAPPAAQATQFPSQSLIIPTQSSYQDPCGMVSTYGLMYSVLRANDGLTAGQPPSGNFKKPITVHWVFSTTKKSPNRCVPTNLDKVYNGSSLVSPAADYLTGNWNDGCDFTLTNTTGVPATLVNNSNTATTADSSSWKTFDTTGTSPYLGANGGQLCSGCSTLGPALAFPNFKQQTVFNDGNSSNAATNVTTLQYAGGAFVISASDALGFLDLLSGVATARDSKGNAIDFSDFKSSGGTTCSVSVNGSNNAVFAGGSLASANVHQVRVHRAQVPFTADDYQQMNQAPPKIGLLQSVDHDYADESGVSVLTGDCRGGTNKCSGSTNDPITGKPIVGTPTGIKGTQLKYYLRSAGLDFAAAGGCPAGGYNDPGTNAYNSALANLCPNGPGVPGQVYDNLDAKDLANGLINGTYKDSNNVDQPNYSVVWAPHWEGRPWNGSKGAYVTPGCDATCIASARAALVTFFEDTRFQRGFLGECATVGFLEGAVNNEEVSTYQTTCNPGYNGSNPSSVISGCHPNERYLGATVGSQSLTCPNGDPSCSISSASPAASTFLGLVHDARDVGKKLSNCSDPTTGGGSSCIHFGNPGTALSQIGDYRWYSYSGGVSNYDPAGTAAFTAGAQRLLYTIDNLNKSTLTTNPTSMAVADNVTFIQRGNDKNKAQLVYLGGHNYTPDVAGTRIALNTVLALGLRALHAESAFVGPTVFQDKVFVPTYNRVLNGSVLTSWFSFDPSVPQYWEFPFHSGALHVNAYSGLANGVNSYSKSTLYGATMPLPGARNVFTYLGGTVSTDDTMLPTSYQSAYGRGVAQIGWKPVSFDQSSLDSTSSSFVDAHHIGPVPVPGSSTATFPGMLGGANGVSDLQEALELSITAADLGSDNGASSAEKTNIISKLQSSTEMTKTRWLIQMVRGYCYPRSSPPLATAYQPLDGECMPGSSKPAGQTNRAQLGGLVHSQPAVVPASTLIPDMPSGTNPLTHRPTVAYVGGLDGQLHAFYVYSDGNDAGYTGPLATLSNVNPSASTVFTTSYSSPFSIPAGCSATSGCGQELWAFIPPGQLPYLQKNTAQVDSSPAVSDVFGDFDGSGVRTWHTVLVASAGGSNREIFALDVTNPLQPVLLWDIQSSYDTQLPYAPAPLQQDDTGLTSVAQAFNWQNRCRAADVSAGTCKAAKYILPPASDTAGRSYSGVFNYAHLGASQSVSMGVLRRNNAPVYAAFVATNEPGGNGIYVFSIDLVTGTKLWEWNNPYDRESYKVSNPNKYAGTGNTPPAGVTILSRSLDDQVNSAYVGDDEGSVWELDASDGMNNAGYAVGLGCTDATGNCNYSLNQAYGYSSFLFGSARTDTPQPVSTLPTLFKVRPDIPVASLFSPKYVGQVMLVYGTAGTDAVASITPDVSGAIHMMPVGVSLRDLAPDLNIGTQAPTKRAHADSRGVDYEAGLNKDGSGTAIFPQALAGGNRVYGSVTADLITGKLYFATTTGSATNIDLRGSLAGNIYQIDTTVTSGNALSTLANANGGVGGTLGMAYDSTGQVMLVASTDQGIFSTKPSTGGLAASATKAVYTIDQKSKTASGLLGWIFRRSGREY